MCQVFVDQPVHHIAAFPLTVHHTGCFEHSQVLADQGLGHGERVHELMYATLACTELEHDGDPYRCCQRP
jgi:hypothetical protein